jgi:hypothetical protein
MNIESKTAPVDAERDRNRRVANRCKGRRRDRQIDQARTL